VGLFALLAASPPRVSAAQGTLTRDAELFADPGQRPVAMLRKGTAVATGATSGRFVEATIDGWIAAPFLTGASDSSALTVKPGGAVRLLVDPRPGSPVVAELRGGMALDQVERRGAWVRVRRVGWVAAASVTLPTAAALSAPASEPMPSIAAPPVQDNASPSEVVPVVPHAATPADTSRDGVSLTPVAQTGLAASPDGARIATLLPGARATVTGRDRGWVRVQVEGWAREADFSVADTSLHGTVSAADLRADPEGTAGRLVHWDIEVLAHQIADPLRKGLANHEPYLLAQGPAGENALLYLAIPPSLAATAAQIPDLAKATVTARVRTGRSEPVGVPVLELVTIVRR
jgi:hypothetical protein